MLTRTKCQNEATQDDKKASPVTGDNQIPDYLIRTYGWAYVNPRSVHLLDRDLVVSAILFFNARRLMKMAVDEFTPGQHVMQSACVYGDFTQRLLNRLGDDGKLDIVDAAPIQISNLKRKMPDAPNLHTHLGNVARTETFAALKTPFDAVCCFFLLHEVPAEERVKIVHNLLKAVKPGGKIVFTDYHQYAPWHPLRPVMAFVFRYLEPYAPSLCASDITAISPLGKNFSWRKKTIFGGLYQIVVGQHNGSTD